MPTVEDRADAYAEATDSTRRLLRVRRHGRRRSGTTSLQPRGAFLAYLSCGSDVSIGYRGRSLSSYPSSLEIQ